MSASTDLVAIGWNQALDESFEEHRHRDHEPARVAAQHRGSYNVMTSSGEVAATITGAMLHRAKGTGELPAVGDWVALARTDETSGVIHSVLPRTSSFSRKVAGDETQEQVVAANVDVVFLVTSLNEEFNPRRLERYLTTAYASGAKPVVILTKADLAQDVQECIEEAQQVAIGVDVHAVSGVTGEGIDALRAYFEGGASGVMLGSSGVGKSTLVNSLLGDERQAVKAIRDDGRGRHTTTHRELIVLPTGGVIIDTPGMRELQLWDVDEGLDRTFEDVASLASGCRFSDCTHTKEPDCAVRSAIEDGTLPAERFESYEKLQREVAWLERKQDKRLAAEASKKWRAVHRSRRAGSQHKP